MDVVCLEKRDGKRNGNYLDQFTHAITVIPCEHGVDGEEELVLTFSLKFVIHDAQLLGLLGEFRPLVRDYDKPVPDVVMPPLDITRSEVVGV